MVTIIGSMAGLNILSIKYFNCIEYLRRKLYEKNRIISIILVVVLLLSIIQVNSFAEEKKEIENIVALSEQSQQLASGTNVSSTLVSGNTSISEGVYYIVNKANGGYLTLNEDNKFLSSTYDETVQWVFKYHEEDTNGHFFELLSNSGEGDLYREELLYERQNKVCFHFYENNTYTIRLDYVVDGGSDLYSLYKRTDNTNNDENYCGWKLSEDSDHSQGEYQWYIYKINYVMGDVNRDGSVNATDANLINRYAARLDTFTETQKYLGDLNTDGIINAKDALLVLQDC